MLEMLLNTKALSFSLVIKQHFSLLLANIALGYKLYNIQSCFLEQIRVEHLVRDIQRLGEIITFRQSQ